VQRASGTQRLGQALKEGHLASITRRRTQRDVGLGPEHDWSSHAADAFGLMAIAYEEPSRLARFNRKIEYPQLGIV
jgi:hypothetical protein